MIKPNHHKILVIDDELAILNLLKLQLNRIGFMADTANSGEEGLTKINSNRYSLILTDIKMHGVSGDQILRYVKDIKMSPIPVVGMSGTPWLLYQNGFDAILSKPFSLKEAEEVLYTLLIKEK